MMNIWRNGMMGLVVGDALGVPVQFMSRDEIRRRPRGLVTGMEAGGVFRTPMGTWSDDSSMALCTLDSILEKGMIDPEDVMCRFVRWEVNGEYTPFGKAFDQGITCTGAIYAFMKEQNVLTCGKTGEHANGNGALMRILPACLYYYERQKGLESNKTGEVTLGPEADVIGEVIAGLDLISGLTHNHLRSKMACGFYYFIIREVLKGLEAAGNRGEVGGTVEAGNKSEIHGTKAGSNQDEPDGSKENYSDSDVTKPALKPLIQKGMDAGLRYYGADSANLSEIARFSRLFYMDEFEKVPAEEIRSSGYVVDSLEATLWCLVTTDSFEDCLLKAVNLGEDTDTIAAIAGGIAGLYYGYEGIPSKWLDVIRKREWLEKMFEKADAVVFRN